MITGTWTRYPGGPILQLSDETYFLDPEGHWVVSTQSTRYRNSRTEVETLLRQHMRLPERSVKCWGCVASFMPLADRTSCAAASSLPCWGRKSVFSRTQPVPRARP